MYRLRLASRRPRVPVIRRGALCALVAAVLALAACSEITGGDAGPVVELGLVNPAAKDYIIVRGSTASGPVRVPLGEEKRMEVRLFAENGVQIHDAAYSLNVVVTDPRVVSAELAGSRTLVFRGLVTGSTRFRIDVYRGDSIVYSAVRLPVHAGDAR